MPKKSVNKEKTQPETDNHLPKSIIAIIFVVLSAIITLSFFDQAGPLGYMLNETILSFLFGVIRFATPGLLLFLAAYSLKERDYSYRPTHIFGTLLFMSALAGLFHFHFEISSMWDKALNGEGGGLFGMSAYLAKAALGPYAGAIALVGCLLISLILLLNHAISTLFTYIKNNLKSEQPLRRLNFAESKPTDETDAEDVEEEDVYESTTKTEEVHEEEPTVTEESVEEEPEEAPAEDEPSENDRPMAAGPWSRPVIIKELPPLSILDNQKSKPTSGDVRANQKIIHDTLADFGIEVDMGEVRVGPTFTQYEMKPHKGIKVARITSLGNDLALALAAHPVRIEAPIPGKSLIGIEVPNEKTAMVTLRELLESKEFNARKHSMMVALGKDVAGTIWFADLPKMPHLLVAGATGSGKTVCVNTIILSLLYQNTAETLRFIMVDPKRVELTLYNGIPHLLTPVITNTQKTVNALKWTISEMERRFEVLSVAGNRDINTYNERHPDQKMPYIVFVIDELADLMATAGNDVEAGIIRIAQMARAVGIHLLVATQRPSVDVITGLMKANIPGRIAFSVASAIDSRTILDSPGAESLLGRGDMLLSTASLSKPVRIQGAFVSEDELKKVVNYLKSDTEPEYDISIVEKQSGNLYDGGSGDGGEDPLFDEAKRAVIEAKKASASLLQRRLKVGYARAARLMDELENAGIIGPGEGAKPREILVSSYEDTESAGTPSVFKPVIKPENSRPDNETVDESDTEPYTDTNEEESEGEKNPN